MISHPNELSDRITQTSFVNLNTVMFYTRARHSSNWLNIIKIILCSKIVKFRIWWLSTHILVIKAKQLHNKSFENNRAKGRVVTHKINTTCNFNGTMITLVLKLTKQIPIKTNSNETRACEDVRGFMNSF